MSTSIHKNEYASALAVCIIFVVVIGAKGQNCGFGAGSVQPSTTPWPEEPSTGWSADNRPGEVNPRPRGNVETPNSAREFYINVPETQSTSTPFVTFETTNMVWAHAHSTEIRIEVDEDRLLARFYVTDAFRNKLDSVRDNILQVHITLRCTEGVSRDYMYMYIIQDGNNQAPQFSPVTSISLTIPQSWPIAIPINLQEPIFVRDLDYTLANARVTLTDSPSGVINPVLSPLFSGSSDGQFYDYKMELFLASEPTVGRQNILVVGSDGVHSTQFFVFLNVTEVVCSALNLEPVFRSKSTATTEPQKVLYYNSTLGTLPKAGDTLAGVSVDAYIADDPACKFDLATDTDLLKVNSGTGQVTFTRDLSLAELETLGRTWIVEIVAEVAEPESGKAARVPLFITIDFESIHLNM